jgi:hypothetical protein
MIIADKNEVRGVIYASDINKFRFNHTEHIFNKGFEAVSVEMLCLINALKFTTNTQNFILNRTIRLIKNIANIVFI